MDLKSLFEGTFLLLFHVFSMCFVYCNALWVVKKTGVNCISFESVNINNLCICIKQSTK